MEKTLYPENPESRPPHPYHHDATWRVKGFYSIGVEDIWCCSVDQWCLLRLSRRAPIKSRISHQTFWMYFQTRQSKLCEFVIKLKNISILMEFAFFWLWINNSTFHTNPCFRIVEAIWAAAKWSEWARSWPSAVWGGLQITRFQITSIKGVQIGAEFLFHSI